MDRNKLCQHGKMLKWEAYDRALLPRASKQKVTRLYSKHLCFQMITPPTPAPPPITWHGCPLYLQPLALLDHVMKESFLAWGSR